VAGTLTPAVGQAVPRAQRRRWLPWAGVMMGLVVGAAGGWAWWRMASPEIPPAEVVRLSLTLPADGPLAPNDSPAAGSSVAISRDGRWVAYLALADGQRLLAVRCLDRFEKQVLAGTEGALAPFFSPDGQWIAFFTETGLKKVPRTGGTPTTVCATPPVTRGGAWGENGTIYFSPDFSRGIQAVAATGGRPEDVTTVDLAAGESNHLLPDVLPGAGALLYTVWKGGDFAGASIWSQSLRTGERRQILEAAAAPRYVLPGFLVFARAGALFAVRFDAERLAISGEPVPVVDGVWNDRATGTAHYAVAQNGSVVYVPGGSTVERRRLVTVDRQGRAHQLPAEPNFYGTLRLSPDGRRIVVEALNDLWLFDIGSETLSRITFRGTNQHPVWAPDGRHVAFSSSQGALYPKLFQVDVDAGGQPEQLTRDGGVQFPSSWSPDGGALAFSEAAVEPGDAETGIDMWLWRPRGVPPATVLLRTPFKEDQAAFSPDGRALAYVSDETGQLQVYVRGFPDAGRRARVSTDGGTEPVWSRRGDELFYRNGRQYLSVPVTTKGGQIGVGRPSLMFEGDFLVASLIPGFPSYDVMPDGQRFIMVARAGDTPRPLRLDVVLGWATELQRRLVSRATP
jgi:serine/threonine-protein kinase